MGMTTTKKGLGAHLQTLTGPLRMMVRIGVERSMTEAQSNDYSRARRNAAWAARNR